MTNLDPEIRKFLLQTASETFSEIRKFAYFKEYDREKLINGILELCAALNINIKADRAHVKHRNWKHLCVKCKINHIQSSYWDLGIDICGSCRWEEKRKNEKKKFSDTGRT